MNQPQNVEFDQGYFTRRSQFRPRHSPAPYGFQSCMSHVISPLTKSDLHPGWRKGPRAFDLMRSCP